MTIINPNSISGITSFTAEADVMNFYRSNGTLGSLQLNGVNFNTTNGISTFNNLNVGGVLTYEDVKNVDSVGIISARTAIHVGAGISAVGIITGTSFRGDGSQLTGITQVGGATTVGFDDNKSIYFGSQDDYRMGWSGTTMSIEPTSSSTTQILHLTSNNQMYIKSKASGLFLMSGNQNVIDIYGGYGGGIYFKNNNTQYLKLEYSNWTFLNNTEVRIPDKLVHAGDENTSIRFPAADTVTVETAGSERLRITGAGNVGIGLTNPSKDFEVYRNGLANAKIKGNVAGGLGAELILQNANAAADGYSEIQFQDAGTNVFSKIRGFNLTDGSNNGYMALYTSSATEGLKERVRISDAGKVGINSISPTYALEVDGGTQNTVIAVRSSDAKAAISFLDSTSGGYGRATIGGEGDSVYITSGAGYERIRIGTGGGGNSIGINTTLNMVTNSEVLAVRGTSSFRSVTETRPALYLGNEGAVNGTANPMILFNGGGANRGGIGYVPNTGELRFNNQYFITFTTGASTLGGTERLRIKSDGGILQTKTGGNANYTISRNESVGTTDQPIGVIDFASNTAHTVQARLMGKTRGTSNVGGDLVVETRADGGSLDERFRITGGGSINFSNTTVATKNTSGDILIDFGNLTSNASNYWRKCGVFILYNGIDSDATDNKSVVYYTGVGAVSTWNWVGDSDTMSNDSFNSVTLQNASTTGFRLYCDVNNQNYGTVFVMIHGWNTKPTITIN